MTYRAALTIGETTVDVHWANVSVVHDNGSTQQDTPPAGATRISGWISLDDAVNASPVWLGDILEFAKAGATVRARYVRVDFWNDDSRTQALCSFSCTGYIRKFEASTYATADSSPMSATGRMLFLELEPAVGQSWLNDVAVEGVLRRG